MTYVLESYDPLAKRRAIFEENEFGAPVAWIDYDDVDHEEADETANKMLAALNGSGGPGRYIVLAVEDGEEGFMPTYSAQVATIMSYKSVEDAATLDVGTYPDAEARGKPYRVIVVPEQHWHELQVYAEKVQGRDQFTAYPNIEDRTIS